MSRVIVVGDVGGHPAELRVGLATVAAGGSTLPPDTIVVQVGDLVDRGPDSSGVLRIVQEHLDHQPDQWVQLLGNHEDQYLADREVFWPQPVAGDDVARLRSWWDQRRLHVATAVQLDSGDEFLLTHAGLTVPAWRDLGEPATATQAARLLNERPDWLLRRGGVFDGSGRGAGPLWADAGWDLYEPWLRFHDEGGFVPFGQIHGHSSVVRFDQRQWHGPLRLQPGASVDWTNRHTRVRIAGRMFIGVDPKHGQHGAPYWRPLVLDGATILTGASADRYVGSAS